MQLIHKDVCEGVAVFVVAVSTTAVGTSPPGRVLLTSGIVAASVESSLGDISSLLSVVVMLFPSVCGVSVPSVYVYYYCVHYGISK